MPLRCSLPPLGWGVCWAAFYRIKRARAAQRCGAQPCSAAAFLQRPFCRAGQGGGSFWPSASRRGWARPFCTPLSSPAPKSGTRAARGWRPGSSAVQWDFPARSLPCSSGRRCGALARCRGSGARSGRLARLLCRCALRAARCSATRRSKSSGKAAKTALTSPQGRCCAQSSTGCVRARCAFPPRRCCCSAPSS